MDNDNRWIHVLGNNEEAISSFFRELDMQKEIAKRMSIEAQDLSELKEAQARYGFIIDIESRINNVLAEARHDLKRRSV